MIVEAAARVLEEVGFEGYTTNAVARRAGVSVGSLYQYFPGKDALTKALIARETETLLAEVAAQDEAPDGRTGLERLIAAAVAHQTRRPKLAVLLDQAEQRLPVVQDVARIGEMILAVIRRLLTRPDMPPLAAPDIVAADLLAIAKGIVDAAGARGETEAAPLERRARQAVFGYLLLAAGGEKPAWRIGAAALSLSHERPENTG